MFVTIGPNRNFTKLNLNFVVKRNVCEERSDRFGNALREGVSKIYHFSHRFKYLCNLTCEQLALQDGKFMLANLFDYISQDIENREKVSKRER